MFTPAEQHLMRVLSEAGVVARISSRLPSDNAIDHEVMFPLASVAISGVLPPKAGRKLILKHRV